MTELRDFKDFLKSVFKSYILVEAEKYLETLNEFRVDPKTGGYRSPRGLSKITATLRSKAEEMSIDFIDELEARNLSTPEDYEVNWPVLKEIIANYIGKYLEWLKRQR